MDPQKVICTCKTCKKERFDSSGVANEMTFAAARPKWLRGHRYRYMMLHEMHEQKLLSRRASIYRPNAGLLVVATVAGGPWGPVRCGSSAK